MKKFMTRVARAVVRVAKRFINNTPINAYEAIFFGAFRSSALQFGRPTA